MREHSRTLNVLNQYYTITYKCKGNSHITMITLQSRAIVLLINIRVIIVCLSVNKF